MTIRYSIPAQLYRLRNDLIIDTHLRLFLIILWCFIRLKAYWKHKSQQTHTHTHTNYVFLQFLISFLNLNHLRDSVDGLFIL